MQFSQIGPYSITRELARGGMVVVYLGRDTRLDRDVAIKALSKPDILFEAQFYKQIVRNFDVFPEADRFIMVSRADLDSLQEFRVVYNWFAEARDALQRAER